MERSFKFLVSLLLWACLNVTNHAASAPVADPVVKAFAESHSANGSAVGSLSWSGKGTGSEKKIGALTFFYIFISKSKQRYTIIRGHWQQ